MGRLRADQVTDETRKTACRLRGEEGLTCRQIAERLGISESVASKLTKGIDGVKGRGPSIHVVTRPRPKKDEPTQAKQRSPRVSRDAHPPGHSQTWGLLWQGTSMEGVDYPGG